MKAKKLSFTASPTLYSRQISFCMYTQSGLFHFLPPTIYKLTMLGVVLSTDTTHTGYSTLIFSIVLSKHLSFFHTS